MTRQGRRLSFGETAGWVMTMHLCRMRAGWRWSLVGFLLRVAHSLCVEQAYEGHLVDALALRGDEGRSTLR